jgi:hypothetical protein
MHFFSCRWKRKSVSTSKYIYKSKQDTLHTHTYTHTHTHTHIHVNILTYWDLPLGWLTGKKVSVPRLQ